MANGEVHDPGSGHYHAYETFGDGCVFVGCTFTSCDFGTGCVFVDCYFQEIPKEPPCHIGPDATFRDCNINDCFIQGYYVIEGGSQGTEWPNTYLGPGTIDGAPRAADGQAITHQGAPAQADGTGVVSTDWCKQACEPAHINPTVRGQICAPVTIVDGDGKEVVVGGG